MNDSDCNAVNKNNQSGKKNLTFNKRFHDHPENVSKDLK